MRIRPYISEKDYPVVSRWITDERTHALWSGKRFEYPVSRENFDGVLRKYENQSGDSPFVATADAGTVIGFFCYGTDPETNEGILRFMMIDDKRRGNGYGKEMVRLALKYAFEIAGVDSVQLNVFSPNKNAKACYEGCGFEDRVVEEDWIRFRDESWAKINMVAKRTRTPVSPERGGIRHTSERRTGTEQPGGFCTCSDRACPMNPANHDRGCSPCIAKNLREREIPSCFFNLVGYPENAGSYHFEDFAGAVLKTGRG